MKIQHLKWHETFGLIALALIFLVLLFIPLPEIVIHYDLYGNPTRIGSPKILAFIPISVTLLFFFVKWITGFDRLINYSVKITPENVKVQKELITKLIEWYGLIILFSTLIITLIAVFVRSNHAMMNLGIILLLSFVFLAPIPYYIHKANKYK